MWKQIFFGGYKYQPLPTHDDVESGCRGDSSNTQSVSFWRNPCNWISWKFRHFRSRKDAESELLAYKSKVEKCKDEHLPEIARLKEELHELTEERRKRDGMEIELEVLKSQLSEERNNNANLKTRLNKLKEHTSTVEKEKEDALSRLSQLVSVKLRDNNPNIVDLNDQYRPTKLAEMFSELYDNEWTAAYTVMEGQLKDTQIISVLLDIVMKSYEHCEKELDKTWTLVSKWYLDEDFPTNQETRKALKDGRKAKVQKVSSEIEKAFVVDLSANDSIKRFLADEEVQAYVTVCVKLCLLMTATDPPVVIECPVWKPKERFTGRKTGQNPNDAVRGGEAATTKLRPTYSNGTESQIKRDTNTGEHYQPTVNVNKEENAEDGPRGNPVESPLFDKEHFKEYTSRGKYLDYVVWPAMFLHKGGAMLGKGVAQGTSDRSTVMRDGYHVT